MNKPTIQKTVTVTDQGVKFGNAWFSHEHITGYTAEQLNSGNCRIAGKAYMDWLAAQPVLTSAVSEVMFERQRQVCEEGWSLEHDDQQKGPGLIKAAGCYLLFSDEYPNSGQPPPMWPWAPKYWKPKDYRRDLVRAGALVLAEIERIDRANSTPDLRSETHVDCGSCRNITDGCKGECERTEEWGKS